MNICIDVRSPGRTGILSYSTSLLGSLKKIDKKNNYIIITDSKHGSWGIDGIEEIEVPSTNIIYWMIWSNIILPKKLKEHKIQIYHTFKHVTAFRLKIKKIVTLQALHSHYIIPEVYKWYETLYWKFMCSMAAKYYDRLITVAEAEKNYLVDKVGFEEKKFRVTYLGADRRYRVINDNAKLLKIKKKYKLPDHFILYVGMIHPRKNIEGIIKGYEKAREQMKTHHKLVIVGRTKGKYYLEMITLIKRLRLDDDVIFTGFIEEDDLPYIYNLARLFLFPSHYESFGIVLIEAMSCGTPVVTSYITDLKEVVQDAGILINPDSVEQISEGIIGLINYENRRLSYIKKGLERAKYFSWNRCAHETIKVYEELMQKER